MKRITPAHAGKRLFISMGLKIDQDHPRACGEKCKEASFLG